MDKLLHYFLVTMVALAADFLLVKLDKTVEHLTASLGGEKIVTASVDPDEDYGAALA